jgi:8-oxo-dGTP pyrophosphatase MutT (NUDIX family)
MLPEYYVGRKTSFIMVLTITEAGDVILLREYKHGVGDYVWNLPAGGIKSGESPEETATRELLEETGYITDALEFVGSYAVSSSWLQDRAYLFIGRNARQVRVPRIESGESITVFFKSMQEVLEMVRINQVQDPYTVLLILYANRQWGAGE